MAEAAPEVLSGTPMNVYGRREMRPDPVPSSGVQLIRVGPPQVSDTAAKAKIGG